MGRTFVLIPVLLGVGRVERLCIVEQEGNRRDHRRRIGCGGRRMIGRANGSTAKGAIIGAAVGGTAGAVIGHQMDQQAKEIKQNIPAPWWNESARVDR
jgi:hypothetical protein